jgi:hypothetical protein
MYQKYFQQKLTLRANLAKQRIVLHFSEKVSGYLVYSYLSTQLHSWDI